jgi:hypothetical protein
MDFEQLKRVAYAEGFIEDFIEESFEKLLQTQDAEKIKQGEELGAQWRVLTTGLAVLRGIVASQNIKLSLARQALDK